MQELLVLLNGVVSGRVAQDGRGRISFDYAGEWQQWDFAYPLSLSMPLVENSYGDDRIRPYLEGLLPDNESILREWGRRFGASAGNPFSLLSHVGEDVAGAVQLIRPERLDDAASSGGSVEWLTDDEVAERLRLLVGDPSAWRMAGDNGYFSLAGAQPKTALYLQDDRWGVPSGRIPTTHILKPPILDLDGLAINEHLCLHTAGALGFAAVNSDVIGFGDQQAIVVERYDRMRTFHGISRIHQEDFCQAAGVSPRMKYEAEGGPDVERLVQIIRDSSSSPDEDVLSFIASVGLHWVLGAPDAHAKNYSILIAPEGQVRLAPLYDVISVLPYPQRYHRSKIRLAMRVGGEYRMQYIRSRHWDRLAESVGVDPEQARSILTQLVAATPDAVASVAAHARRNGLDSGFVDRFSDAVVDNARRCAAVLQAAR